MSLSVDDYECVLCLRLLYEPCTLRCGHSFCVRCCRDLARAKHAKCPTCRRVLPLHGSPTDMAASLSLATLLAAAFPEAYASRKAEDATEAELRQVRDASAPTNTSGALDDGNDEQETTLPLFYLDPMLPRQRLQLNIFEPRYRLMIRRCLEGSRRFGMLGVEWLTPLRHMGQRSVRHGVEVEIVENAPQPDGRFHIEIQAGRRFEIVGDCWEHDGYAMATVRWVLPPSSAAGVAPQNGAAEPTPRSEAEADAARSRAASDNASEHGSLGVNEDREAAAAAAAAAIEGGATGTTMAEAEEGAGGEADGQRPTTAAAGELGLDSDSTIDTIAPESSSGSASVSDSLDDAACLEMAAALETLVEEWKELVATGRWERFRGQLGRSLADLGPMPAATDLDGVVERALWVGALINPLPGLGVATEVRPFLLAAASNPHEMVQIVTDGTRGSIAHMTPSPVSLWVRRQLAHLDWFSQGDENGNGHPVVSLAWLWRFLTVAGVGGLLALVCGTFVLVCLGIRRGFWYLLEAQHVMDASANVPPVDLTHYTTRTPPPPSPPAFEDHGEL